MQDHLREIEGTLARTSERKNTILYKLTKRRAEEERLERLGINKIPPSPHNVNDISVIKFVLHRLKQEIGDKIARIRNASFISIEKDGEGVVRARNDEINKLIAQKNQWENRLAILKNEGWVNSISNKVFFGCAKDLPEAATFRTKRERPVLESDEELSSHRSQSLGSTTNELESLESTIKTTYLEKVTWLLSPELEEKVLKLEKESEINDRQETNAIVSTVEPRKTGGTRYISYFQNLELPEEKEFERMAVEKRKLGLKKRLESLKDNI
ncbi:unnamed protein product [Phytomonas sp. Hart1]|nr:unnamed protein product [Phytomonas sp. Hart1]|eukprot:CCW72248.1 unnamed protein product [Phytomonas sp. isolate Hart1]